MLKLLILIGLAVAGYFVAKKVIAQGGSGDEMDDLYGSADIHRTTS